METKERIIDLRQFFIYLWEKKWIILLVTILFTGVAIGYSYNKQLNIISSTTRQESGVVDDVILQNHDAFYHLNDVVAFTDADQPAGTYNSSAKLFVDFNFSTVEGNSNLDYSQMVYKFQQDAMLMLVSSESMDDVIEKLDLRSYDDLKGITSEDLKWMVNRNFMGANVLQIVVTDVDPERAQKIADAVVNEFLEDYSQMETIDNVKIIDPVSKAISGKSGGIQTTINKKSIIKYGIAGVVGGMFLSVVLFLIVYILYDTIRTSLDVEFADVSLYGTISRKNRNRNEDIKRIAYNISLINDIKRVYIVPTDKYSENKEVINDIKTELSSVSKNIVIEAVNNIKESAEASKEVVNGDAVIILSKFGKTRMKDLIFAKNEIDKTGIKILGVIIGDAR